MNAAVTSTFMFTPAANEDQSGFHVQFTAFLRYTPIRGKRFETVRDLEKRSWQIELALDNLCGISDGGAFDFAKPVAFTPAFGDKPARFTIHGHACKQSSFTNTPAGQQLVISDNHELTGSGAGNKGNIVPDPILDALCKTLKAQLESATGLHVYRLELAGFIYGVTGRSFPL